MSIEERFTQNLTDHYKENKKGLIPKCDYQKTIDALKAAGDNSHAKGRLGYYLLENGSNKKWIMVYQDHLTKFCILRALTSKRAAEVAFHLLDIFLLFGAPVILQSDNGSEFTSQVITELKEVWPKLTLVHGKPRHPQSQGSVERANGDIKYMLVEWMAYNDSQDWPTGIKFVQFQEKQCSPFRDKVLSIFCNVWL
ncbi:hypothetical protein Pmani_033644 [Petrolisthes manimaculis]|uniref:Integrase catalytic domain-containing protein n=1 Tax=Petrolisthes manimaculis TaxID=1843537 RepID=A0AAE1TPX1_9EUCA|nr:hypothetical protein Pmani_033644 [Petrolisthes manimaculis]